MFGESSSESDSDGSDTGNGHGCTDNCHGHRKKCYTKKTKAGENPEIQQITNNETQLSFVMFDVISISVSRSRTRQAARLKRQNTLRNLHLGVNLLLHIVLILVICYATVFIPHDILKCNAINEDYIMKSLSAMDSNVQYST